MLMLSTLMLPYFVDADPAVRPVQHAGLDQHAAAADRAGLSSAAVRSSFSCCARPIIGLPRELDDAAKIDGAGFFRIWWSVLLPLTRPALATVAILSLVFHWNDFVAPLVYLNSQDNFTLALGVRLFRDQYRTFFNQTMAFSTMMSLPICWCSFIFQKHFVRGITMSGLTGR